MKAVMAGVLGAGLGIWCLGGAAWADDRPFAFAYSTAGETKGETEIEQEVTWKSGHANAAFQGLQSRTELEYGFSDRFQGSLYLVYDWERERAHPVSGPAETSSVPSLSGEFIYYVLDVYFDPIGLALYAEPSVGNGTREFELKALLQKNFLNDDLRLVLNINFEDSWEKNSLGHYDASSALEFYTGIAYNVTPEWSLAAELDNERGFDGLILGGSSTYTADAWYFGPTVSYAGLPLKVVFGIQTQLPWAHDATHTPGAVSNGYLADAEHFRLRLRLAKAI
jgi:hypothetical protein